MSLMSSVERIYIEGALTEWNIINYHWIETLLSNIKKKGTKIS
jgi:hypothetical protein